MADVLWNEEKNKLLLKKRNIGFGQIAKAIAEKRVLNIYSHPNKNRYKNQKIMLVNINNYVYVIPFVEKGKKLFLKTIYASRKHTKKYLNKE